MKRYCFFVIGDNTEVCAVCNTCHEVLTKVKKGKKKWKRKKWKGKIVGSSILIFEGVVALLGQKSDTLRARVHAVHCARARARASVPAA